MPAEIKPVTKAFHQAVRQNAVLRSWAKEGTRRFWDRDGEVHRGIELVLFKHSYQHNQMFGLAGHLGVPTLVMPIQQHFDGANDGDLLVITTYFSAEGGTGPPNLGGNRVFYLEDANDVETFISLIPALLSDIVVPWMEDKNSVENFLSWYLSEHSMPWTLPLLLATKGVEPARRKFAEWLETCPDIGGKMIPWLELHSILPPDMVSPFSSALLEGPNEFCIRAKEMAHELLERGA